MALIWLACYAVGCAVWPLAKCTKCDGKARFMSPSGKAWRLCPRCKGTGARLRIGRRIWNYLAGKRRDGTKRSK